MRSNATWIAWTGGPHRNAASDEPARKEADDERSRELRAGRRLGRGGPEGWGRVDAHPGPGSSPPAGEGLAGADRPRAAARMGAIRRRSGSGDRRAGEALDGRDADPAGLRDHR